jgi:PKD repeat protein
MGAMLLILITLVAAASLAVIVSQAGKQQADRQAHQAAVANENLAITGIDPEINPADISSINSLFITVQNLNIDPSRLMTIYVNDKPCHNYSLVSINGIQNSGWKDNWAFNYNLTSRYDIPAKATVVFNLNLTAMTDVSVPWDFPNGMTARIDHSITIKIMTSYINVFNRTFSSPNAVASVKVLTQDLGNFKRDYLYLDGSGSTSDDSIVGWTWNIFNATNYNNLTQVYGKTSTVYLNFTGPLRVNLTVTDSNNLTSTSDNILIPQNDAFSPPAHILWQQNTDNTNNYTLTVVGVDGNPIGNMLINMIPQYDRWGNLTLDRTFGYTNNDGTFNFTVLQGSGTLVATAGNTGSLTAIIPISYTTQLPAAPLASFIANITTGTVSFAVQFTDTSTNIPTSWLWNFGDGQTSTSQNPVHTYTIPAQYTVSLMVTNAGGSNTTVKSNFITANAPPVPTALFIANQTSGTEPLYVQFTDQSTNSPTSWSWDFGDGTTSTAQNPMHIYTTTGSFTVSLTVTNAGGTNTLTNTNYITVNALAPTALFIADLTSGSGSLTVQFTDQSTGTSPMTYLWDFGDSTTSTAQNPTHTYTTGSYTVTLTVTNIGGTNAMTRTNYIIVS